MTHSDLLRRIAGLEELPVSEEMLGAYLEGNLTADEAAQVDDFIADYPELLQVDDDFNNDIYPEPQDIPEDIELPEIPGLTAPYEITPGEEAAIDLNPDHYVVDGHDGFPYDTRPMFDFDSTRPPYYYTDDDVHALLNEHVGNEDELMLVGSISEGDVEFYNDLSVCDFKVDPRFDDLLPDDTDSDCGEDLSDL